MGQSLLVSVHDGVADVVFNRPERRNPIDYATLTALLATLREADANPAARCVLLRGAGSGFSSGGDLAEFQGQADRSAFEYHETGAGWAELMTLIPRMTVPVVVAAHGFAMAGACGLTALADVALAAEGTKFGAAEVKIGLFPLMILPALSLAIGSRRARELAITGRVISAEEALRIGLVHRVLPKDGFVDEASAVAASLASLGRRTLRLGKAYLRDAEGLPYESAVQLGRSVRGAFMSNPDFEEGVSAFLEKRGPRFE